MPPGRKIQKEDIINIMLEILKSEDITSINARKIAKELHCSVQPIFYNFSTMDELKNTVIERIYQMYQGYMNEASKKEKAYKEMGLAYISFARDYPNYFKLIFMNQTDFSPEKFITNDSMGNRVIENGMKLTGFCYEKQKEFHLKVWIFTHGLACLVATKTVKITNEEISSLLEETVREMALGQGKD